MNKLKKIRAELNLTQKQLAEVIGVSRAQVANIEQGIRVITPRIERDLISHLNVNPEWLENGVDPVIMDKYSDFDLDSDEKEFLELFETLDKDSKTLILETMKKIASK
ncbi:MAG: helix-turn-helix transcriptional regulator [Paraclostridium sp.]